MRDKHVFRQIYVVMVVVCVCVCGAFKKVGRTSLLKCFIGGVCVKLRRERMGEKIGLANIYKYKQRASMSVFIFYDFCLMLRNYAITHTLLTRAWLQLFFYLDRPEPRVTTHNKTGGLLLLIAAGERLTY